jgi:hypothetical protein
MGVALFIAQLGQTSSSAKFWKGLGPGGFELVEDHRGDTFRAVYTVRVSDAVHVLHAFHEIETPAVRKVGALLLSYGRGFGNPLGRGCQPLPKYV